MIMCNGRGIGRYIVEARKKKGMSQKQLSEKDEPANEKPSLTTRK